jgi:hypothetical protein
MKRDRKEGRRETMTEMSSSLKQTEDQVGGKNASHFVERGFDFHVKVFHNLLNR